MRQWGIDISAWQGDFDLARAKREGVQFVLTKGGGGDDGLYVDGQFAANYEKARTLGIPVGCYWFSRALTVAEAEREAAFFYENCLKGRQFGLPVFIDVENRRQLALGRRALTNIVKAWCHALERRGYYVGIYSALSFFSDYLYDDELTGYAHWVACWAKSCDYEPASCFGLWQFGGETNFIRDNHVAGVVCDQDYLFIDYETRIRERGLNGFPAQESGGTQEMEVCTVELPVLRRGSESGYVRTAQILLNKYNNAQLMEDGIFGAGTQQAVIAYQRDRSLEADGIIGEKTWAQLLR